LLHFEPFEAVPPDLEGDKSKESYNSLDGRLWRHGWLFVQIIVWENRLYVALCNKVPCMGFNI